VTVPTPVVKPYGWMDGPVAGRVTGKTRVHGWALSDQGEVTKLEILLDGTPLELAITRFRAPGICAKYPARAGCPDVGFEGTADFARVPTGEHTLSLRLTDSAGSCAEIAKRAIVVE